MKINLIVILNDAQRGVLFEGFGQRFGRAVCHPRVAQTEHFKTGVDFQRFEQPVSIQTAVSHRFVFQ